MSIIKINDVELDLDIYDADVLEKYENENAKIVERINERTQYQGKTNAEAIRIQCGYVEDFFNNLFGDGTADKVFKGKHNLMVALKAFEAVTDNAIEQKKAINELSDSLTNKYSANRAERRANAKGKGKGSKNRPHNKPSNLQPVKG